MFKSSCFLFLILSFCSTLSLEASKRKNNGDHQKPKKITKDSKLITLAQNFTTTKHEMIHNLDGLQKKIASKLKSAVLEDNSIFVQTLVNNIAQIDPEWTWELLNQEDIDWCIRHCMQANKIAIMEFLGFHKYIEKHNLCSIAMVRGKPEVVARLLGL